MIIYCCQNCGCDYDYDKTDSKFPEEFCGGTCEGKYLIKHGGQRPPITKEIPLGTWEPCNLHTAFPAEKEQP